MPLTLATNIGQADEHFLTPVLGIASPHSVVRVIEGPAHVGSAGLRLHRLPFGLTEVNLREVRPDGTVTDTGFTLYGADLTDDQSIRLALLGKGLTDAQGRAAFGAAPTTYAGFKAIGLAR